MCASSSKTMHIIYNYFTIPQQLIRSLSSFEVSALGFLNNGSAKDIPALEM
jgi:hypothetical protein